MTKQSRNYSLGASFAGFPFYLGLIGLIFSAAIWLKNDEPVYQSLAVLLAFLSVLIAPGFNGVKIDANRKIIFPYYNLFILKIKKASYPMDDFNQLVLSEFKATSRARVYVASTTIRTKVFEIHLVSPDHPKLLIMENTDYKKARLLWQKEAEALAIDSRDLYEDRQKSAQSRRALRESRRR